MTNYISEGTAILHSDKGVERVRKLAWFIGKRLAVGIALFLWLHYVALLTWEQSLGLSVVLALLYDQIQDVRWCVAQMREHNEES